MKKRTLIIVLLSFILALSAIYCVELVHAIIKNIEWANPSTHSIFENAVNKVNNEYLIRIICFASLILLNALIVVFAFPFLKHPIRYTYEQYKEMRQKRKAEKLKSKKESLQKQLNEIEKDTK